MPLRLPNLNKLFRRLSIRAKLQIAFVLLAAVPLGAVASLATVVTVTQLRRAGQETLQHDLRVARDQALEAHRTLEGVVSHFALDVLAEDLCEGGPLPGPGAPQVQAYLARQDVLFQVRVIGPVGRPNYQLRAPGPEAVAENEGGGAYYLLRAEAIPPGGVLTLPVEVLGDDTAAVLETVPVLALLVPVHRAGALCGVVVGEAYAEQVFRNLENATLNLTGVTALIDPSGLFLFHSEGKHAWSRLAAGATQVEGITWVPPLAPPNRQFFRSEGYLVASTGLRLGNSTAPLMLYRAVNDNVLLAPTRRFLMSVAATGLLVLVLVVVVAGLAAQQLTTPVVTLRDAALRLAAGEAPSELGIATNDEIEDLADSFTGMAQALTRHRRELEGLVAERTRELEATHAELAEILSHSADAIIGLDGGGRIRMWNHGAERLLGWSEEEVLGQDADGLLLPPGDREAESRYIADALAQRGEIVNMQTHRQARDGRLIPVSVTQTVIPDPMGVPRATSIILRDVSQQRDLEVRMLRSERLAAVSLMAAEFAHEINNPVAVMANRIELMEAELTEANGDARLLRDLAVLREHAVRLGEITRNLRHFAAEYEDGSALVDLPTLLHGVAGLLQSNLAGRGVALRVEIAGAVPPVTGSNRALETLLINLVNNGAEAMSGEGSVVLGLRGTDDTVELWVQDQGPGIPPELQERVFEPFFSTKGSRRGMGLGLALCRSIVERHGGSIVVDSTLGEGTTFRVTLPTAQVEVE